ncbi:sulfotransferase [Perlabentimonas gracilis]|uniref:sulfotransferase n=1 Tax=Perlabentimonas gracilis TaxID=2715279 RepID=UPI00140ABFF7|nr:sulfotransferase [Perlabentimonas gracilis]NHB67684.1 sulfotransferase [Perlabentimonas gracilis]
MRFELTKSHCEVSFLFIGYCDRSGSTFLLKELSNYEGVIVCPEADVLVRLLLKNPSKNVSPIFLRKFNSICKTDPKLRLWDLSPLNEKLTTRLDLFFKLLIQFSKNENRKTSLIVFKERSILHYKKILESYPVNSNFLAIIRDPRAVFLSQKKAYNSYRNKPLAINPVTFTKQWNSFIFNLHTLRRNKEKIIEVKYENLINKCEITINSILQQLIPLLSESRKDFHKSEKFELFLEKESIKHSLVGHPPHFERIDAWKTDLSLFEITYIERETRKKMQTFGYITYNNYKKNNASLIIKFHLHHFVSNLKWRLIVYLRKIRFVGFTNNQ